MPQQDRIAATKTAFEILDIIHESQGATAKELITATELSRGGVYKHLRTLVDVSALVNRNGVYVLGPKLTEYGLGNTYSQFLLKQTPKIDDLAQSLNAPTNLWINNDDRCHCVHTAPSTDQNTYPRSRGDSELLVQSPPGKVILAHLPRERHDNLIEAQDQKLASQLKELRERQLLEEPLSFSRKWTSIATPVIDPSGHPVAAIEIVISSERATSLDVEYNISGLLTDTANKIRVEML
ncbi:IclR family transcriptional regulator [Halegenticoccus tardaugens]|uniref:IclR family transcriptional regulator n=1 Tax=Halegenticoccus tardaugens TaxID=2071624 RepID=UPI00100C324A|nr:IclR family transcriptional regulator C-terminal domain-containing protein [Halegenticoccus tardaugens]